MIRAIGMQSEKVYAEAETKADLFKKLQSLYPDGVREKTCTGNSKYTRLYPEPLIFKRGDMT